MRKNNRSNPAATAAAFTTLTVLTVWIKRMIKKYHKKQEIYY